MRTPERKRPRGAVAVALSTDRALDARRRAREAGFDGYLTRPFDPARLVQTIGALRAHRGGVLVVDDDCDAADSLAILLERRGFEVERAYTGAQALEVARRFAPGAVVTDLRLGDLGGADVARALRGLDPWMRVIAVTGSAREDLGPDAVLFDGFVRKPIEVAALLALLRPAP
jgi:CheY-like chemotaxis protein